MQRHDREATAAPVPAGGLVDVECEAATLVLTDPRDAFGFTTWPRLMHAEGLLTDDDVARWEADVDAAVADGEFLYAVTFFITSSSNPDTRRRARPSRQENGRRATLSLPRTVTPGGTARA